jgi:CBS domain-containing protein
MKIREIMTADVQVCQPDTDLGKVASMMWDRDCGIVPVVGPSGAVIGLVTDRDICIAAATRGLPPERISAAQAMGHPVRACFPDDSVQAVLATMKEFKLRRLPVIDSNGILRGIASMNDIVRAAERRPGIPAKEIVSALVGICEPRVIAAA